MKMFCLVFSIPGNPEIQKNEIYLTTLYGSCYIEKLQISMVTTTKLKRGKNTLVALEKPFCIHVLVAPKHFEFYISQAKLVIRCTYRKSLKKLELHKH